MIVGRRTVSQDNNFIAYCDSRNLRHINDGQVHRDSANDGSALALDDRPAASALIRTRKLAPQPVRVTHWK
jgi:hypothetical protein